MDNLRREILLQRNFIYSPYPPNKDAEHEASLLDSLNPCPIEITIDIKELNTNKLYNIIRHYYYNWELMKFVSCVLEKILTIVEIKKLHRQYKIKKYITHLHQIGDPSANGYAFLASLINEPIFIVKSPQSQANAIELNHECVIGLLGTNQLRRYIPNFAYVYGTFRCSPPILEGTKVIDWCSSLEDNIPYAIYENIPGITLFCFLKNDSSVFLPYYLQILFSLSMAHSVCSFTHYDLHLANVLMRPVKENTYLKYVFNGQTFYIKTHGAIATIIDYGMSYIKVNNVNYNYQGDRRQIGIFRNQSFLAYDFFMLLISITYLDLSPEHAQVIISLLRYVSDDPINFIKIMKANSGCLPASPQFLNFNCSEFIVHVIQLVHRLYPGTISLTLPEGGILLNCGELCPVINDLLDNVSDYNLDIELTDVNLSELPNVYREELLKLIEINLHFERHIRIDNMQNFEDFVTSATKFLHNYDYYNTILTSLFDGLKTVGYDYYTIPDYDNLIRKKEFGDYNKEHLVKMVRRIEKYMNQVQFSQTEIAHIRKKLNNLKFLF